MRRTRLALLAFLTGLAIVGAVVAYMVVLMPPRIPRIEGFALEEAYVGLNWVDAIAFAPDGRLFFAERLTGNIRIVRDGVLLSNPFFSVPSLDATGERGLLGLAVDPGFPQQPWVYAYYTYRDSANGTFENRIVRIQASGDTGSSMEILLGGIPSATIHNGGVIGFGPDGKLWAVVGDGAVPESAQNLSALTGKVLRLEPDGGVPTDNPFVGTATASPYVYSYGHRNMFGLAFHPGTHAAYVTENGPSDSDEINRIVPGGNYGWPVVRGIARTPPYIDPLLAYTPVIVPTNAVFAAGSSYGPLQGDLIFGDYAHGRLHDVKLDPPNYSSAAADAVIDTAASGIVAVAASPDGFVWAATASTIYRLVPVPVAAGAISALALLDRSFPTTPRNLSKGHDVPTWDAGVPHPERGPAQAVPRAGVRDPA